MTKRDAALPRVWNVLAGLVILAMFAAAAVLLWAAMEGMGL